MSVSQTADIPITVSILTHVETDLPVHRFTLQRNRIIPIDSKGRRLVGLLGASTPLSTMLDTRSLVNAGG